MQAYEYLKLLVVAEPPAPWRAVIQTAAGGSFAAGFDRHSERLLTCSESGQAIIDCRTGERLHRSYENNGFSKNELRATALDGSNLIVDTSGPDGGRLPQTTGDGWTVEAIPIVWPEYNYFLNPPGCSVHDVTVDRAPCPTLIRRDYECTAFGFSWSGNSLVWLDRADLLIWTRD